MSSLRDRPVREAGNEARELLLLPLVFWGAYTSALILNILSEARHEPHADLYDTCLSV